MSQEYKIIADKWWAANGAHVGVVAVEGAIGDWAAYIGIGAGESHQLEAHDIAARGGKLLKKHACLLFPYLNAKRYRE